MSMHTCIQRPLETIAINDYINDDENVPKIEILNILNSNETNYIPSTGYGKILFLKMNVYKK